MQMNKRYEHGVLQLEGLNKIYSHRLGHVVRGYFHHTLHNTSFTSRHLSWIIGAPFVFLSLTLSAMQVGMSLDELKKSEVFQRASYAMVLLSLICVVILLVVVFVELGLVFSAQFADGFISAIRDNMAKAKTARLKARQLGTRE